MNQTDHVKNAAHWLYHSGCRYWNDCVNMLELYDPPVRRHRRPDVRAEFTRLCAAKPPEARDFAEYAVPDGYVIGWGDEAGRQTILDLFGPESFPLPGAVADHTPDGMIPRLQAAGWHKAPYADAPTPRK